MIEAMACGTPVVAFRHGSAPEVVEEGASGFLVNDENEGIAAASGLSSNAVSRRGAWPRTTCIIMMR
jgi:glycosyltransferase involved in cell wall biosynthesis